MSLKSSLEMQLPLHDYVEWSGSSPQTQREKAAAKPRWLWNPQEHTPESVETCLQGLHELQKGQVSNNGGTSGCGFWLQSSWEQERLRVFRKRRAQNRNAPSHLKLGTLLIKTHFLLHKLSCYVHTWQQVARPHAASLQYHLHSEKKTTLNSFKKNPPDNGECRHVFKTL